MVAVIQLQTAGRCNLPHGHWPHMEGQGWCPGRSGNGITIYHTTDGLVVVDRQFGRMVQEVQYLRRVGVICELTTNSEGPIYFEGTRRACSNNRPHGPHPIKYYPTVRYGQLTVYCPGVSGEGLVVGEDHFHGSAHMPDQSRFRVARLES